MSVRLSHIANQVVYHVFDLKFLNQAPLYNKNIILLDSDTYVLFLFNLILRMNNKLPLFITLINDDIINKKHCMQMYGHTMLSN
jgi:hypothetical protein